MKLCTPVSQTTPTPSQSCWHDQKKGRQLHLPVAPDCAGRTVLVRPKRVNVSPGTCFDILTASGIAMEELDKMRARALLQGSPGCQTEYWDGCDPSCQETYPRYPVSHIFSAHPLHQCELVAMFVILHDGQAQKRGPDI